MKSTRYFIPLLTTIIFFYSCGQPGNSEKDELQIEDKELPVEVRAEKALYDEVMAVHDEVMPKMDDMMRLKGQLQTKLDLAREQEDQNEEQLESLEEAIKELEAADEAMMQWMRDFEPKDNADHQLVMQYYQEQKKAIEKVKEKMLQAMDSAKERLK